MQPSACSFVIICLLYSKEKIVGIQQRYFLLFLVLLFLSLNIRGARILTANSVCVCAFCPGVDAWFSRLGMERSEYISARQKAVLFRMAPHRRGFLSNLHTHTGTSGKTCPPTHTHTLLLELHSDKANQIS